MQHRCLKTDHVLSLGWLALCILLPPYISIVVVLHLVCVFSNRNGKERMNNRTYKNKSSNKQEGLLVSTVA